MKYTQETNSTREYSVFLLEGWKDSQYNSFNAVTNHRERNQFYALVVSVDLKTCKCPANIIRHLLKQLLYNFIFFFLAWLSVQHNGTTYSPFLSFLPMQFIDCSGIISSLLHQAKIFKCRVKKHSFLSNSSQKHRIHEV